MLVSGRISTQPTTSNQHPTKYQIGKPHVMFVITVFFGQSTLFFFWGGICKDLWQFLVWGAKSADGACSGGSTKSQGPVTAKIELRELQMIFPSFFLLNELFLFLFLFLLLLLLLLLSSWDYFFSKKTSNVFHPTCFASCLALWLKTRFRLDD